MPANHDVRMMSGGHRQQITHPRAPGCLRRKPSFGGIWRPGLGRLTTGGIWSCLSSLLGPAGTWSLELHLELHLEPGLEPLQRFGDIWSCWRARQLPGGSSCSRTLQHSSPGRWCSPRLRASQGWRRTSSGSDQPHRRTDYWNICYSHSSAARKIVLWSI